VIPAVAAAEPDSGSHWRRLDDLHSGGSFAFTAVLGAQEE